MIHHLSAVDPLSEIMMKGPQGPPGPTSSGSSNLPGPQGITSQVIGVQGPQGVIGVIGMNFGSTGTIGVLGPQGATGGFYAITGATGPQGIAGIPNSVTGSDGPQGATGNQGINGILGMTGNAGPQGTTGPVGRAQGTLQGSALDIGVTNNNIFSFNEYAPTSKPTIAGDLILTRIGNGGISQAMSQGQWTTNLVSVAGITSPSMTIEYVRYFTKVTIRIPAYTFNSFYMSDRWSISLPSTLTPIATQDFLVQVYSHVDNNGTYFYSPGIMTVNRYDHRIYLRNNGYNATSVDGSNPSAPDATAAPSYFYGDSGWSKAITLTYAVL